MRARLTVVAALVATAVAASPAAAQVPLPTPTPTPPPPPPAATPTPTPTPTPSPEDVQDEKDRESKSVRRIYRDFERDGRIDDCDHTAKALKKARRSIEDEYAEEYPDFRDALTAALERHRDGRCVEETPTPTPTPTPAPSTGTTPPPASTPAPLPPPPPPSSTPESGDLPDFGGGSDSGGGGGGGSGGSDSGTLSPPGEGDIPEGSLPSPTPTATPAPVLPPKLVVTRAGTSPNLLAPGVMAAIALLGLLIAGLVALYAKRTGRLAGVSHAWSEASWRASGTWSEFTDWLRGGR